jgi:hypothetical protein
MSDKHFRDGHVSVEYPRCRQPSTLTNDANIEHVHKVVQKTNKTASSAQQCNVHQSVVKKYSAKHNVMVLEHRPHSLDLSPPDFFLFPQLKNVLKGKKFASTEEYTAKTTKVLKNGFQECFQNHYECWQKCVTAQGNYFEGNAV